MSMSQKHILNKRHIDEALFALINGRTPAHLDEILSAGELFPYLEGNGVAGVWHYCLEKSDLRVIYRTDDGPTPGGAVAAMRQQFLAQVRKNMAAAAEAKKVFSLFNDAAVPFIVLKGISLAETVYPHFAMRTTSDLDVLIKKEDLFRAHAALTAAGYRPLDGTPEQALQNPPGYLASLEYHKADTAFAYLHLHWHLINTSVPAEAFIGKINMERIWDRSVTAGVAGAEVRLLSPEHLVIYLCEHALRVGHSFDRLILICDIIYAVQAHEDKMDWKALTEEAAKLGLLNFAYLALKIVRAYSGPSFLSNEILDILRPPSLSLPERFFLHLQENHHRLRGSAYLVYLGLRPGVMSKGRLILHTFFPPPSILAQRRRLPLTSPTSLYFERIREIISQIGKILRSRGHNIS